MIACAVCGKPANAMTTLTNRLGEKTYTAERYAHARDVCITEWHTKEKATTCHATTV